MKLQRISVKNKHKVKVTLTQIDEHFYLTQEQYIYPDGQVKDAACTSWSDGTDVHNGIVKAFSGDVSVYLKHLIKYEGFEEVEEEVKETQEITPKEKTFSNLDVGDKFLFQFQKDYANNWKKGDRVFCVVKENNDILVDGVALIPLEKLMWCGYFA